MTSSQNVVKPTAVPSERRRRSIKVLMQPTKAVDSGWSWIVCMASFTTNFILLGTFGSFGVLYVQLLELYGGSNHTDICSSKNSTTSVSGQTAWIGNQATLLTFSLGPLSAALVVRWGVRPVVTAGAVLFSAGMFLTATTNEIWQATLTYGVIGGLGGSMIYTPTVGSLPAYFQERKAFAISFAQSGRFLGNVVLVPIFTMIRDSYGWRSQCIFMGSIGLLVLIMGLLYRPRHLQPDVTKPSVKDIIVGLCRSQRHIRFSVWLWAVTLHFFQIFLVLFHLGRHAECKMGVDPTKGGNLIIYLSLVAAICGMIGGIVQDHITNKMLPLQLVIFIGGVANLSFPSLTTYSHLVGFAILIGIADSFLSLMSIIPQHLVGSKEAVNAFGVLACWGAMASSLGGPAGGWVYDTYGSYDLAFYLAGSASIISSLLMFTDYIFARRVPAVEQKQDERKPVPDIVLSKETSI